VTTAVATPRWERYAHATRVDYFAWWASEHCIQSVGKFAGSPLALEEWQLEMMGEALAETEDAQTYWLTTVLVIPKKNGKTSLLAAFGLFHLLEDEGAPEILLAAATDKQAGRLFETAVRFVRSDPWLDRQLVVREHEGEIARADGFSRLFRVSADSGAASGYGPSLVVADELADWYTPRRRRTWANIATAGQMVRAQAHVFVISTAGEPSERVGGILGQLIDGNELDGEVERVHRALTISRNHPARTLVYNYDARTHDPQDLDAIKAANPASWVTVERLAEVAKSPALTPGRFLQLHGCVWTTAESGFLELEDWRVRADPEAQLAHGDTITAGFLGGATCALVACRRLDDTLFLRESWEPQVSELVDAEDVDDAVQAMIRDYRLGALFACASPEWATLVDGWRAALGKRRVTTMLVDRPSPRTADATQRFRADVLQGRVRHDGNPTLAAHVVAARIARSRNLPYLVSDERGDNPISACQAALLAWEANAVAGPAAARGKGYVMW
jgi:phage terminase large subunit-like protein